METVPVATFNEAESVQQLLERLNQAGIPATIRDESKLERFWFVTEPFAAIHLEVSQKRYLEARRLIEEWDRTDQVLRNAVRCPECNSSRVEYPQLTRKFILPTFLRLCMALGIVAREFYCLDCHYTWPTVEKIEPRRDVLGFRYDSKMWHPEQAKPHRTRV